MSTPPPHKQSAWLGVVCIAVGLIPIAHAFDLLLIEESAGDAPRWVIGLCGIVFVLSGFMMMAQKDTKLNNFLAAILLGIMGSIGMWVSLFAPSDAMSGGVFFLSQEQNVLIARFVFGIGAIFGFLMCAYAVRLIFISSKQL